MERKPIEFRRSAREDLRDFPQAARREAGFQLDRVQCGLEPENWKPMSTIGAGVREISIADAGGAFRVICMLLNSPPPSTYCTASKRRASARANRTSSWRPGDTANW